MKKIIFFFLVVMTISEVFSQVNLKEVKSIMGNNFLGPEEIKNSFGFNLKKVPIVQFSTQELKKAKEQDMILVFFIGQDSCNEEITIKSIVQKFDNKFTDGKNIIIFKLFDINALGQPINEYNVDWYKNEDFFLKEKSRFGWYLIPRKPNIGVDFRAVELVYVTVLYQNSMREKLFLSSQRIVTLSQCNNRKVSIDLFYGKSIKFD